MVPLGSCVAQQFAIFKFFGIRVKRNASWGTRQLLVKYVKHSFVYYEMYRKFLGKA